MYRSKSLWLIGAAVLLAVPAAADTVTDFESPDYTGSAAGELLTGQQGWYNPVSGSNPYYVFTYAGNAFGLAANPAGSEQFVAAERGSAAGSFGRAQHDDDFTEEVWTVAFDICGKNRGELPALDNLGSLSLQPTGANPAAPDSRMFILLYTWTDVDTATNFDVSYIIYNSAGELTPDYPPRGTFPGPEWQGLEVDHWYRLSNTIDFAQNKIIEISITDLTTGATATITDPVDPTSGDPYYLGGGADPGALPLPTGFRFFTGGGIPSDVQPGNTTAWDNLVVEPYVECVGDLDGDGITGHSDLGILLSDWGCEPPDDCVGDLDGDGYTGHSDLGILLSDWGCGT